MPSQGDGAFRQGSLCGCSSVGFPYGSMQDATKSELHVLRQFRTRFVLADALSTMRVVSSRCACMKGVV